jgi:imidazolonepropionase-like amidohydrolase
MLVNSAAPIFRLRIAAGLAWLLLLAGSSGVAHAAGDAPAARNDENVAFNLFPSTYRIREHPDTLLVNATILDGAGRRFDKTDVLFSEGRIVAIGSSIPAPKGVVTIDAGGRWITPGIIDPHSHLGSASVPYTPVELQAWDVNELGDPIVPHLYVESTIRTQDPGFAAVLAGGVTTIQVLPGSANLFGGLAVILKNVVATTPQAMKYPGAPPGMKMACGENPKYTYSAMGRAPRSRMGIVAGYQQILDAATKYREDLASTGESDATPPAHDQKLAVIAAALEGNIRVHFHCYRAEDMAIALDVAKHYGLPITAFHHASEAYKIPELFVENDICGVVFANWWGFKMENYDAIRENAAFLEAAGACVTLHSDSAVTGQRLNIEAAKAMAAGNQAGLDISREEAIRWITLNPAIILGLEKEIGSLEPGKNADLVLWSGDPFSVYTKADMVFIDGTRVFDRGDTTLQPKSDFSLGQPALEGSL